MLTLILREFRFYGMSAIVFELKKIKKSKVGTRTCAKCPESIPGTVTRNHSIIIETVSITGTNFGKWTRIELTRLLQQL